MEQNENNERPRTEEEQRLYNFAQVCLARYMLSRGVIEDFSEYSDKYAEVFEMLATGCLHTERQLDWGKLQDEVKASVKKTL
jgi:hypothetical protein